MTDDGRFRIVSSYTLAVYPCGIHAGQNSQLKRDLPIRDPTGTIVAIYQAGGVWQVLKEPLTSQISFGYASLMGVDTRGTTMSYSTGLKSLRTTQIRMRIP